MHFCDLDIDIVIVALCLLRVTLAMNSNSWTQQHANIPRSRLKTSTVQSWTCWLKILTIKFISHKSDKCEPCEPLDRSRSTRRRRLKNPFHFPWFTPVRSSTTFWLVVVCMCAYFIPLDIVKRFESKVNHSRRVHIRELERSSQWLSTFTENLNEPTSVSFRTTQWKLVELLARGGWKSKSRFA